MAARAVHYDSDTDKSDHVFCGTEGEFWPAHLTGYKELVTCKHCLKILARIDAQCEASTMRSKAAAWDRMYERANQIGYRHPWDALAELCRQKGVPLFGDF